MKTNQILTNFTAGVFSPRLNGRVDIAKYYNACRTCENMIVYPHGGASRRFGTVFVAETKDSDKISRLIPFQFNIEQAYILECGDKYIRFYKDNAQIVSGTAAYEIESPYSTALLDSIRYAQNADTMRLVNQTVAPQILTRTGHTAWTLATSTFIAQPADWSAASGYPSEVVLYEQRSCYAGTTCKPNTLWFSATGNLDDMTASTLSDDGMELTLDDNSIIRWILAGRFLNIGTGEAEWVVSSGATDEAITPTKKKARRISRYGSASISAVAVGNAILFVQRVGRKLRELIYDYAQDSFGDPPDLTIFAEHVTKTGIKSYAFQREPDSILWCVLNDGTLAAFTYNKAQEITGWHSHSTDGLFEDVEVIPTSTHDQVWFIVNRTLSTPSHLLTEDDDTFVEEDEEMPIITEDITTDVTKRYIEYLADDFNHIQHDCWFVDCGLKYDSTAATNFSGMDHLEGKIVSILADGAVRPDSTIVSGMFTLNSAASVVIAGLPFTSVLEPMDLETKEESGTSQGKIKKIHSVIVRFYESLGAKIGSSAGTLDIIPFRKASDPMDSAPDLFTGDKVVPFPGGWERHGYIRITQEQPLPLTVIAIIPQVTTND